MNTHKHGMSKTRLYKIWSNMKRRCYNKNSDNYDRYGGRGIVVCEEWKNDFMCFHKWAMENGYREGLTIDRKDNDGNYDPSNCRWVTTKEQENNRGNFNINVTYQGKTQTLMQWAEELCMPYATLRYRIVESKWPIEDAFTIAIGEISKHPMSSVETFEEQRVNYNAKRREKYQKNKNDILKKKEEQRREKGIKTRDEYNKERQTLKSEKLEKIKTAIEENPSYSIRQIANITGIHRTTIHRLLRKEQA